MKNRTRIWAIIIVLLWLILWLTVWVSNTEPEPIIIEAYAEETIPEIVEPIVIETEAKPIDVACVSMVDEKIVEYAESIPKETETVAETEPETEVETPAEKWIPMGIFTCTAYDLCPKCCGKNYWKAITRSGTTPARYRTVATDPSVIPLGTRIYIDGIGYRIAEDTGSAVKKNHIDIYVGEDNHSFAAGFGKIKRKVWIIR